MLVCTGTFPVVSLELCISTYEVQAVVPFLMFRNN